MGSERGWEEVGGKRGRKIWRVGKEGVLGMLVDQWETSADHARRETMAVFTGNVIRKKGSTGERVEKKGGSIDQSDAWHQCTREGR